jgi:uncharacterized phage infection (PIP) family protein YhgE
MSQTASTLATPGQGNPPNPADKKTLPNGTGGGDQPGGEGDKAGKRAKRGTGKGHSTNNQVQERLNKGRVKFLSALDGLYAIAKLVKANKKPGALPKPGDVTVLVNQVDQGFQMYVGASEELQDRTARKALRDNNALATGLFAGLPPEQLAMANEMLEKGDVDISTILLKLAEGAKAATAQPAGQLATSAGNGATPSPQSQTPSAPRS